MRFERGTRSSACIRQRDEGACGRTASASAVGHGSELLAAARAADEVNRPGLTHDDRLAMWLR